MGSRNFIGKQIGEDIRFIYCHFGADLLDNGILLKDCWQKPADIDAMLDGGDIVALGESLAENKGFKNPEGGTPARVVHAEAFFKPPHIEEDECYIEVCYLWKDDTWYGALVFGQVEDYKAKGFCPRTWYPVEKLIDVAEELYAEWTAEREAEEAREAQRAADEKIAWKEVDAVEDPERYLESWIARSALLDEDAPRMTIEEARTAAVTHYQKELKRFYIYRDGEWRRECIAKTTAILESLKAFPARGNATRPEETSD